MVSFNFVSGKKEDAIDFLKNKTLPCRIFRWSRVANYSVMMAHASIPEDKRRNWNHR
jgi:cystathionine beta-lyase